MLTCLKFSFLFLFLFLKVGVIFAILERGKLRSRYYIIVKSANVFHEKLDIFFHYFNWNVIIVNRCLFAEVFDFPNNIDLFNSTERRGASFICILYCCNARVFSVFCN